MGWNVYAPAADRPIPLWARATGHESPGRAQLACSIARVAGCLHTDVSSPWLTHDWSDVRWDFDLRQAVGVGGLTAAAGIAIRSASCQQPRVAARWHWPFAIGLLRRRSTASPPIRPAQLLQLLQLLLSVFCSHSPRADCAPRQAGHMLMQTVRELGCAA